VHRDDSLPPYLDGWDELSCVLDDDPELHALSALGCRVDAGPAVTMDGQLPF
jgi:hypothetical protein